MSAFQWPLQRVLDVTQQREDAYRAELQRLASEIEAVEAELARREGALQERLGDVSRMPMPDRFQYQQLLMQQVEAELGTFSDLRERASSLETERAQKREELMQVRSSRKALERLRSEAKRRHVSELRRREQKEIDEAASIAFVRNHTDTGTGE